MYNVTPSLWLRALRRCRSSGGISTGWVDPVNVSTAGLSFFCRNVPGIDQRKSERLKRMDDLAGRAVDGGEGGSQDFVSLEDGVDALFQNIRPHVSCDPESDGDIVHRIVLLQLLEEPEPSLHDGKWNGPVLASGRNGKFGCIDAFLLE